MDEKRDSGPALEARHERSDFDPKRVALIGGSILALLGLVSMLGSYVLFRYFTVRESRSVASAPSAPSELPPAPRLQTAPGLDLEKARASAAAELEGYGWVDRNQGVVRIPIARAMDLLAGRLPVVPTGAPRAPESGPSVPARAPRQGSGVTTPEKGPR